MVSVFALRILGLKKSVQQSKQKQYLHSLPHPYHSLSIPLSLLITTHHGLLFIRWFSQMRRLSQIRLFQWRTIVPQQSSLPQYVRPLCRLRQEIDRPQHGDFRGSYALSNALSCRICPSGRQVCRGREICQADDNDRWRQEYVEYKSVMTVKTRQDPHVVSSRSNLHKHCMANHEQTRYYCHDIRRDVVFQRDSIEGWWLREDLLVGIICWMFGLYKGRKEGRMDLWKDGRK